MPNKANLEQKIAKYKETLAELAGKAGQELESRKFSKLLRRSQRTLAKLIKDEERHATAKARNHARKAEAAKAAAPVEETPKPEAPAEAKKEEAPVEKAPVEEARPEAPVKKAPAEKAPKPEAPVKETPAEEAPKPEAPAEEAPAEKAPAEEAKEEKAAE